MCDGQLRTFAEFLSEMEGDPKYPIVERIFSAAPEICTAVSANYREDQLFPEFRITPSLIPSAEGVSYVMHISEGMVRHCINLPYPPAHLLIDWPPDHPINPMFVAESFFAWVVAHEWFHIVHDHDGVLRVLPEQIDLAQAALSVEHDADLCAAALVYRFIQNIYQRQMGNLNVRKLTFFVLYWGIRTLNPPVEQTGHTALAARLLHIIMKLSMVSDGDEGGDYDAVRPETRQRSEELTSLAMDCEEYYQSNILDSPEAMSWIHEWHRGLQDDGDYGQIVETWSEVNDYVVRPD